jgi:hypothetical protein
MSWHSPACRSPRKRWTSSWLTILRGFEELLACADGMAPGHRYALLHGLLDAADGLDADSAASWWAGCCAAESPGSAGPLWTGCAGSTGQERRYATPGRTL